MENALKAKPEDIREQCEVPLKELQEACGEAMMELCARKKLQSLRKLSQGVPAVGLAYSDKFVGVFASLGLEQLVVDLRSAEAIAAMDTVARVFRERCRWGQAAAVATARARDALLSLSLERI